MSASQLTTIMEEIVGTHLPKLSSELQAAKRLARKAATKESLEALTSDFNIVSGKVAAIEQQLGASTDSESVLNNAAAIIVHPYIHIHLPHILMTYLFRLQINEHKTFEDVVVENEVYVKIPHISTNMLLTRNKSKPFTQFQYKILKVVYYSLL